MNNQTYPQPQHYHGRSCTVEQVERLGRQLPGRHVTDGDAEALPIHLWTAQRATSYAPWMNRPDDLANWTPDKFESSLERDCIDSLDRFELDDLVNEQVPLRYFN